MILFATFCIAALGFSQGKNDHLISEINYQIDNYIISFDNYNMQFWQVQEI